MAKKKVDGRQYTDEQLAMLYRQIVKMKKQRTKEGKKAFTEKQISDIVGLTVTCLREIWKEYVETRRIPKPKTRGRKLGEKKSLEKAEEREIKRSIVDKNPSQLKFACFLWTASAVRELIKRKYGKQLGKQTVREYLASWGMSCQRPAKQAYKQKEQDVKEFKEAAYPAIKCRAVKEKAEIYFGDETGINNQAHNPRGYAPKNNPPVVKVPASRETVNMISAVSPSGRHKFLLFSESMTQQKLIEFMDCLIKDKAAGKNKVFLVLDNLKVHHGKLVLQWLAERKDKIEVFYFPSYSPEINPDEYLNNILKQNMQSGMPPKNKKEIYSKANKFMKGISKTSIQKIFLHPKLDYQNV